MNDIDESVKRQLAQFGTYLSVEDLPTVHGLFKYPCIYSSTGDLPTVKPTLFTVGESENRAV